MPQIVLLCLCLLLFLSSKAQNVSIAYENVMDVNMIGQGYLRPRIVINGDGQPVVLWGRYSPNANFVAVGNAGGFNMATPVHIPGELLPAVSDWQGSSIAAAGNTVWIVFKGIPEDVTPIYVRRSDDGGTTWQDTIRVQPNQDLTRFPSITIEDPDRPIIQYMEFDDGFMGARYVVTKMENGSFGAPVQVSSPFAPGNVCDCCPGQVISHNDQVAALYRNAGNDERVMWGAFSNDEGDNFPTGSMLDMTGWIINQCMSSGPDGLFNGDSIRYVWMSGAQSGSKVYLGSANVLDSGIGYHNRLFDTPQSVSQNYPRIAGSGDTLGVVWQQSTSGQMEVLFSWSVTGPGGLSVPDTVNIDLAGMQQNPDIAYSDGAFHIVWGEMGSEQVRYRKATLDNTVQVEHIADHSDLLIWPNPTEAMLHISSEEWIEGEIIDLNGRIVWQGSMGSSGIDVSRLPVGNYLIHLVDRQGRTSMARFEKVGSD